ncbi:type II toxin-antitoxin system RelE/ParE family toxin [Rickettsia endosymbiont of Polydrusus tereticollis]|uniref:type II toxin-antitoxin system RelE/ParE family toxin n=1 Tax=Rickettsia endosymbiont of Polydrusus tereticollis TaxID=3066251 RepID=UPI003132FC43
MKYTLIYGKRAVADKDKLTVAKLIDKAQQLCNNLVINPTPPNSKRLYRDLAGKRSIRINLQHRLIYEILEDKKIIKILRMWGHYE